MHDDEPAEDDTREFRLDVEADAATDADAPPPVRIPADQLAPDTLRAVIESFVLREGTDYGERETTLETKVRQVMRQIERGDAHVVFDPGSETVSIVVTRDLPSHLASPGR